MNTEKKTIRHEQRWSRSDLEEVREAAYHAGISVSALIIRGALELARSIYEDAHKELEAQRLSDEECPY